MIRNMDIPDPSSFSHLMLLIRTDLSYPLCKQGVPPRQLQTSELPYFVTHPNNFKLIEKLSVIVKHSQHTQPHYLRHIDGKGRPVFYEVQPFSGHSTTYDLSYKSPFKLFTNFKTISIR